MSGTAVGPGVGSSMSPAFYVEKGVNTFGASTPDLTLQSVNLTRCLGSGVRLLALISTENLALLDDSVGLP